MAPCISHASFASFHFFSSLKFTTDSPLVQLGVLLVCPIAVVSQFLPSRRALHRLSQNSVSILPRRRVVDKLSLAQIRKFESALVVPKVSGIVHARTVMLIPWLSRIGMSRRPIRDGKWPVVHPHPVRLALAPNIVKSNPVSA